MQTIEQVPDTRELVATGSAVRAADSWFAGEQRWPDCDLLHAVINSVDEGLMVVTTESTPENCCVEFVNPAFTRITGYSPDQAVGQHPSILVDSHQHAAALEHLLAEGFDGAEHEVEMANCDRDGRTILLAWRATPVRVSETRVTHCLCLLRDVTEQRSAERHMRLQEQELARVSRLSTLGEMAGAIGHELNQPLFAILNYVESCRMGLRAIPELPVDLLSDLHCISSEAERAGDIIRRVRRISGKREPCRSSIDLNAVVLDALKVIEREAQRDSVSLRSALTPDLPLVVTDSLLIQQVIINLARNAFEALQRIPEGRRELLLRTATNGIDMVELALVDNGPGLDGMRLDEIFMPFQTTKPHHVGLGLSLSQAIIEREDGQLTGESNRTGGMTFRFTLPAHGGHDK